MPCGDMHQSNTDALVLMITCFSVSILKCFVCLNIYMYTLRRLIIYPRFYAPLESVSKIPNQTTSVGVLIVIVHFYIICIT